MKFLRDLRLLHERDQEIDATMAEHREQTVVLEELRQALDPPRTGKPGGGSHVPNGHGRGMK